jgi:hypothetical protein
MIICLAQPYPWQPICLWTKSPLADEKPACPLKFSLTTCNHWFAVLPSLHCSFGRPSRDSQETASGLSGSENRRRTGAKTGQIFVDSAFPLACRLTTLMGGLVRLEEGFSVANLSTEFPMLTRASTLKKML